ncbi:kinesin-like protein KIN-13A [Vigna radiata var. radiata]|uniref:Kinesin-like protein KIN-13A n=1 Tax=Vigna radiata var. radiata TaxID=3916 RepID=A0A3Q0EP35_VIGRR|nr:kinesin-like protein KIN-13A [Vigna radiata var. radiata]
MGFILHVQGDFGSGLLDLHAMDDTELLYEEEVIQSSSQIESPGMHMIYLPYSDDIKLVEELHECFGAALVGMGPATLLSLVPLNLEGEDLSDDAKV